MQEYELQKILLIEDDHKLGLKIKRFLEQHDYEVEWLNGGSLLGVDAKVNAFDVILCDIDLPDMSGFDICNQWRDKFDGAFIFITAFTDSDCQIEGLEMGADDFIVKPFVPDVLLARVRTAIRKLKLFKAKDESPSSTQSDDETPITLPELHLTPATQQVKVADTLLNLTQQEFKILYLFARNFNYKVTRDVISKIVMNREYDGFDRSVDVYVSKLRKKFNTINGNPYQINTLWGKGYVLTNQED
ncbi:MULTISPECIES: response regulator transcription factor [unclassified Thalassotalea]|uniref:response regulator transcription factor n=1 Tax=unclassified Thalassotalea TaxID=2614972 RepID=UPI0010811984|nr:MULTISPECIES: response regulator transcription factor [unclassified Thalassotalea]NMP14842.1 response regulator transcription factor [Thalassotalea sp. Y01]QBY03404.1 response regulator transcription factor [Thalassotalea sp. HSM 43]